jgi:hypothetical protein
MVGLAWGVLSNNWWQYSQSGLYTFPEGIFGGSLFAVANLLIPTVVNRLGLGVGFMLWNATNITFGFLISRFGLFGVEQTIPSRPLLSMLGIVFMLGSIGVYGKIRPTLSEDDQARRHKLPTTSPPSEQSALLTSPEVPPPRSVSMPAITRKESLGDALIPAELPNFGPFMLPADVSEHVALEDRNAEANRKFSGVVLALVVGAFLSGCMVPYANWQRACRPVVATSTSDQVISTCNPLNFAFSQCLGVYLLSSAAFLIYSLFHRFILRRSMPRSAMRPAYICGVLWAFGLGGQLYSFGQLGFDQAFPLTSIGPAMVSMLWSACYFKEMEGQQNRRVLALGTAMVLIGTLLRVVSM